MLDNMSLDKEILEINSILLLKDNWLLKEKQPKPLMQKQFITTKKEITLDKLLWLEIFQDKQV